MDLEAEKLIESIYPQMLRSALLLTGERADAEDLAQEAVLRALASWSRYRGESTRKTWLYSILVNLHKKQIRSRQRRWARWLRWFDDSKAPGMLQPEDSISAAEWKDSLWSAVARLPLPQQHVVLLRFTEEMSYEEIARVLNCPAGTVKSRLNSALKKLGDVLVGTKELADIVNAE